MRIVFFGTPEFALPALRYLADAATVSLVVTQPDRPQGRGRELQTPPVAQTARLLDIPVVQPSDANDSYMLQRLRDARPDVLVVVAYGRLIGRQILELCPGGVLNLHPSLLPAYRGAAPIQAAIFEGRVETGVTLMRLDEGFDTGPVVAGRSTPIGPDETAPELQDRLATMGAVLILEKLGDWVLGRLEARAQDSTRATIARPLTRADAELDVRRSATQLYDQWRAFQPWPGTYVMAVGTRCKLLRVQPVTTINGQPGAVMAAPNKLLLHCGRGALRIEQIQPAGRRAMSPTEFMNGYAPLLGKLWGYPYPISGEPLVRLAQ